MTRLIRALRRSALPLLLFAAALSPGRAAAQDPAPQAAADSLYEVRLSDGSILYGRVTEQTADEVVIVTESGTTVRVRRAQVASMERVRGRVVAGQVWNDDPHATRLFFAPTARAIPRGEGYLGVYELFFPFVSYGVTDRFTISAGTPIVPEAIGEVFYLAPKLEVVRTPGVSAAVGVLALFAPSEVDGSVGLVYGVGTFGGPDRALTVGATLPFVLSEGDNDLGRQPAVMIGGESRLTRRTKLLTENYFVPGEGGSVLSGGIRFFGERLSADFGAAAAVGGGDNVCCLPLVNFVYTF